MIASGAPPQEAARYDGSRCASKWTCSANTNGLPRRRAAARRGVVGASSHYPGVSIVRYRYRAYPTGDRKVREIRLDAHHKLALRLVRDNQAAYAEDLFVAGLARTKLSRSMHDSGWSILVLLIVEKAAHRGRTVVEVDRRFPSSQLCTICGHRDGPKPLAVRAWTGRGCGAEHDRDRNAARNVLADGSRIAAGLAEIENACGAGVRRGSSLALGDEAGTRLARLA